MCAKDCLRSALPALGSACTPQCADAAYDRQALEQLAATARARHWPTSAYRPTPQARWCSAPPAECEASWARHRPVRLSWARLLKRVFALDLEHCPNCGGELKIIAAIMEQPVIEKILTHLGLQVRAPRHRSPCKAHVRYDFGTSASPRSDARVRLPITDTGLRSRLT